MMPQPPIKHDTAGVFIFNDAQPAKVLLHRHRKFGKWMEPGGHVEAWENPLETAIRECKEETGLDLTAYLPSAKRLDDHADVIPAPQYVLEEKIPPHGDEPEHYHIDSLYVVHIPEQAATAASDRESQDIAWFTADQVKTLPMFDNVRTLLTQEFAK